MRYETGSWMTVGVVYPEPAVNGGGKLNVRDKDSHSGPKERSEISLVVRRCFSVWAFSCHLPVTFSGLYSSRGRQETTWYLPCTTRTRESWPRQQSHFTSARPPPSGIPGIHFLILIADHY